MKIFSEIDLLEKESKKRAPLIAILGPDGSGKTTLVSSLTKFYGEKIDVEKCILVQKYTFFKKMFKKKNLVNLKNF